MVVITYIGTFTLTDEPHNDPPIKTIEALHQLGIDKEVFVKQSIGETIKYSF